MASMPKTVAIIGSAIAGPTLALQILSNSALRSAFRPILFDQSPAPGRENQTERNRAGASVGLFANGLYPLHHLGLKDDILQKGFECRALSIWSSDHEGNHERLAHQENAMWSPDLQTGVVYFERHALQSLLVDKVEALGGEVSWNKKATNFETLENGQTNVTFSDGTTMLVDLLVGADGGYSAVRKHVLNQRNKATAEQRWIPDFMGLTGFYGVGNAVKAANATGKASDSHCVWLEGGFLSSGPCPDGKVRWDLILLEREPPASSSPLEPGSPSPDDERWQSNILPSQYQYSSTVDILRKYRSVFHPYSGNLEALLNSSDRIIRSPLRQRVWKSDEIQCGNVALIGDAARLMLPTSGQGTGFAIEDATVLARNLLKHASTSEYSMRTALEDYARGRVPRSRKMATAASFAASMGTSTAWYWRAARYYGSKWQVHGQEVG